jgi:hypothetical protein
MTEEIIAKDEFLRAAGEFYQFSREANNRIAII